MNNKQKADKANRLLTDPAFVEGIASVKKEIYRDIAESEHDQQSLREDAYYLLKAVDRLELVLKRCVNKGKV